MAAQAQVMDFTLTPASEATPATTLTAEDCIRMAQSLGVNQISEDEERARLKEILMDIDASDGWETASHKLALRDLYYALKILLGELSRGEYITYMRALPPVMRQRLLAEE